MSSDSTFPKHLLCQMCSKPFSDPRMLTCLHSFCCLCLHHAMEKAEEKQSVQCPVCLLRVPIPEGGANVLPRNLHVAHEAEVTSYVYKMTSNSEVPSCSFCVTGCNDPAVAFCCTCRMFLCTFGHMSHKRAPQLSQHKVLEPGLESVTKVAAMIEPKDHYCSQPNHTDEKISMYCNTCSHLICRGCALEHHKEHNTTVLSTVANGHRDQMREALQGTQSIVSMLTDAIGNSNRMAQQIESSKVEAKSVIDISFRRVMDSLEERKQTLLAELENMSLSKMASLTLQREEFEKMLQKINHCSEVTSDIIQTHTDHEVVSIGDLVATELTETIKKVNSLSLTPNHHSYIKVSAQPDELIKQVSTFGSVLDIKCTFSPKAVENVKYHIDLETRSSAGERYPFGDVHVEAELRSKLSDTPVVSGKVEDHMNGTYTITLTPQSAGPHQLHITVDGQHVQSSPYDLSVRADYTKLCNPQRVINVEGGPWCVAIHENGDVYVGSGDGHIYVFDQDGHLKNTIGSKGSGNGQFCFPISIFIKGDVMYVADYGNHRIQKLTTQGKFLDKFGEKGPGQGQLYEVLGVIVDGSDRVIVSSSDKVQVFSQKGCWLSRIDGYGSAGQNSIKMPYGLATDPDRNFHVLDRASNIVNVYTAESRFVRTYGGVRCPTGIAIDDRGYSFVTEFGCNCLTVFDPQGHKVHTVQGLHSPHGIALNTSRGFTLCVANRGDGNILLYAL